MSWTFRQIKDEKGKDQYRLIIGLGPLRLKRDIEIPALVKNSLVTSAKLSKEIRSNDANPVALWITSAGKGVGNFAGMERLEERAKGVEWAMVLR